MGWTILRLGLCLLFLGFISYGTALFPEPRALQFVGNQLEPLLPPPLVCCDPACPACVLGPLPPAAPYGDNINCNGGRCPCISCTCCYTMTLVYCETITCTSEATETLISSITNTFTTFTGTLLTDQIDLTFTVIDTIFFTESVTSTTVDDEVSSVVTSVVFTTSATTSTIFLTTVFETTSSSLTTTIVINTWPSRDTITVPVSVLARRALWPRSVKQGTFSLSIGSYAATRPSSFPVTGTFTPTAEVSYTSIDQLYISTESINVAQLSFFRTSVTSTVTPIKTVTTTTRKGLIAVSRSVTAPIFSSSVLVTRPTLTTWSITVTTSVASTSQTATVTIV